MPHKPRPPGAGPKRGVGYLAGTRKHQPDERAHVRRHYAAYAGVKQDQLFRVLPDPTHPYAPGPVLDSDALAALYTELNILGRKTRAASTQAYGQCFAVAEDRRTNTPEFVPLAHPPGKPGSPWFLGDGETHVYWDVRTWPERLPDAGWWAQTAYGLYEGLRAWRKSAGSGGADLDPDERRWRARAARYAASCTQSSLTNYLSNATSSWELEQMTGKDYTAGKIPMADPFPVHHLFEAAAGAAATSALIVAGLAQNLREGRRVLRTDGEPDKSESWVPRDRELAILVCTELARALHHLAIDVGELTRRTRTPGYLAEFRESKRLFNTRRGRAIEPPHPLRPRTLAKRNQRRAERGLPPSDGSWLDT